jgi:hypothetical protein
MRRLTKVFMLFFLVMAVIATGVRGEAINFKAAVQTWFSYAEQEAQDGSGYGFTLRRVRLKPYGSITKKIKWTLQVGWDKQSPKFIEAYLDYIHSKGLQFRVGQFTPPGAMSSTLTSSFKLDFLERPTVTQKWAGFNGLTSYRAVGIQVHGHILDDKLYYAVMLANPKTSNLFNPGVAASSYSRDNNGVMFWGRLETELTKGLKLGAFYGGGKETDTDYKRTTYGAHLYYVNKGVNFKVEYLAGESGIENFTTKYYGYYAVLGYKTGKFEPIARYDSYTPNDGNSDTVGVEKYNNITVGINYYLNKNVKLQANYVFRDESIGPEIDNKIKNNLFYVCFQFTH